MDEDEERKVPVVRLGSEESPVRAAPVRLDVPREQAVVSQRLEPPARANFESRTHQPGIEALIEIEPPDPDFLEQDWGKHSSHHRPIPWGWFILIALILAGAVIWSLFGVKEAEVKAEQLKVTTGSVLGDEAREELEAGKLVDRIETVTRQFFDATSVEAMTRLVRHPERVRPLMDRYYQGKPIPAKPIKRAKLLQPLTIQNRANFWMSTAEFPDRSTRTLVIEILEGGEPRIDWETLVHYQPMKWDDFATVRPAGISMDFRVYVEQDNFFSHEFADPSRWKSFRLTAPDSDETLFGYAKIDEATNQALAKLLTRNRGRKTSVIVRVTIPEGLQSRRGVVIEKLLNPGWLYVNPPEA